MSGRRERGLSQKTRNGSVTSSNWRPRAFLTRLDAAWADHLALAEDSKEGSGLRRYGGKDPGIEYVRDMAEAFERTLEGLFEATIRDAAPPSTIT